MKKNPYKHYYVTIKINDEIEKILFTNILNYNDLTNLNPVESVKFIGQFALANNKCFDETLMLLSQSILHSKIVVNDFIKTTKAACFTNKKACVHLIVDIHEQVKSGFTTKLCIEAFNDKRDCFEHIANDVSDKTMKNFVDSLSNEMQDELFDI